MSDYPQRQARSLLGLLLIGAVTTISCGDDPVSQPTEGTIRVATNTEGSDFDVNGYTVTVNNVQVGSIGTAEAIFVDDLDAGNYQVGLGGLASNCSIAPGENPITVVVTPADTVTASFEVICEPPPTGGE